MEVLSKLPGGGGLVRPEVLVEVRRIVLRLCIAAALGAVPLWGYAFYVSGFWRGLGPVGVSVAVGAVTGGLGFLFAFPVAAAPRAPKAPAAGSTEAPDDGGPTPPTHLESIADWLTKAITGASLVTFQGTIWPKLVVASRRITDGFGAEAHAPSAVGWAYLLFFSVMGFMFGFLPARFYLTEALSAVDNKRFRQGLSAAISAFDQLGQKLGSGLPIGSGGPQHAAAPAPTAGTPPPGLTPSQAADFRQKLANLPSPESVEWNSDPNKGKFDGSPKQGKWSLTATITPLGGRNSAMCRVHLKVTTTGATAAGDTVELHLHPTFIEPIVSVPFTGSTAEYEITTFGAFTVGAVTPDKVKLELDLTTVLGGTRAFYDS